MIPAYTPDIVRKGVFLVNIPVHTKYEVKSGKVSITRKILIKFL